MDLDYYTLKKFIKKSVGKGFSPKDIRTAKVNLIFISKFGRNPHRKAFETSTTKSGRKKVLSTCIEETADIIGHTKGVCKSAYLSKPMIDFILA